MHEDTHEWSPASNSACSPPAWSGRCAGWAFAKLCAEIKSTIPLNTSRVSSVSPRSRRPAMMRVYKRRREPRAPSPLLLKVCSPVLLVPLDVAPCYLQGRRDVISSGGQTAVTHKNKGRFRCGCTESSWFLGRLRLLVPLIRDDEVAPAVSATGVGS